MEKTAKCIKMLRLLNTGRIYKVKELADLLETNERNVIAYKEELNSLGVDDGFIIVSKPGKYGGYQLNHTYPLPRFKLTPSEKKALTEGTGYLNKRNDFLYNKDFQSAMSKVLSAFEHESRESDPLIYNRFPLAMPNEELEARYKAVERSIEKNYELKIEYTPLVGEPLIRVIQPYKLYSYNNAWYFIGYDTEDANFFYYKLNRIKKLTETTKKFKKKFYYSESDYLDSFGMKQNGEWYPIKLKICGFYATIVKEHVYGKNQIIEELPDGSVILSCEMQNKDRIESFALSLGKYCEIMEPDWLKKTVVDFCVKIVKDSELNN